MTKIVIENWKQYGNIDVFIYKEESKQLCPGALFFDHLGNDATVEGSPTLMTKYVEFLKKKKIKFQER